MAESKDIHEHEPSSLLLSRRADVSVPVTEPLVETVAPLSFAQSRLWILSQLEKGWASYNVPLVLRIRSRLNDIALEKAVGFIVGRHQALRTIFTISGGGDPVQVVHAHYAFGLKIIDLTSLAIDRADAVARYIIRVETSRPFDLATGPVFRSVLLKSNETDNTLILTLHHIVTDGWSLGILSDELLACYRAFDAGDRPNLPSITFQYSDYAREQRQRFETGSFDAKVSYWLHHLQGPLPSLNLPTDYDRMSAVTGAGSTYVFMIPLRVVSAISDVARQAKATDYMAMLSAFFLLLHLLSGQVDIIIGTPTANRTNPRTEQLIGFFVNMLPIRQDLSGNPSFRELLRRVRKTTTDAFSRQDTPFEYLVERLNPNRDPLRSPIFQVQFVYQNVPLTTKDKGGLHIESVKPEHNSAKFDLTFSLTPMPTGVEVICEYRRGLFKSSTIAKIAEAFSQVLEVCADSPDLRIDDASSRVSTVYPRSISFVDPGVWSATEQTQGTPGDAKSGPDRQHKERSGTAERMIANLMSELLGDTHVGVNESFFSKGGHSLLCIKLAARIGEIYDIEFPVGNIFAMPTAEAIVRSLVAVVGDHATVESIAAAQPSKK